MGGARQANSRVMMACRIAGRLGDGGGPGCRVHIFPPPRPVLSGEASVLQASERDAAQERVPVQAGPGPTLDMAQSQVTLELRAPEERHSPISQASLPGRWRLSAQTAPSAIRTDAERREPGRANLAARSLGAPAPGRATPGQVGQDVFRRSRLLVRHRFAGPSIRWHELHVCCVDRLIARDAHGPVQPARIQTVAERSTGTVTRIGQHGAEPGTGGPHAVQFGRTSLEFDRGQRDLALAPPDHLSLGHACPGAALGSVDPFLGQKQLQANRH